MTADSLPSFPPQQASQAFTVAPVRTDADLQATIVLFRAYVASLGIDLAFQDIDAEMQSMPGKYAAPGGELWLARRADHVAGDSPGSALPLGCVALRALPDADGGKCCELKRLYVTPDARGMGLGRALLDIVIAHARKIGYREMRLDTLPTMHAALALYGNAGFVPISAYYETPIAETRFLAKTL